MNRQSQTLTTGLDFDLSPETLCTQLLSTVGGPDNFDLHDVYIVRDGKEFDLIGRKRLVAEAVKLLQTSARVAIGSSRTLLVTLLTNANYCAAVGQAHDAQGVQLRWLVAPAGKKTSMSPSSKSFRSGTAGRIPPGRSLAKNWASLRQRSTGFSVSRELIYGRWPITEETQQRAVTARIGPKMDNFIRTDVNVLPAYIFTDEDHNVFGLFDLGLHTAAKPRKDGTRTPDMNRPAPAHRGSKSPEPRILLTQCAVDAYEADMVAQGATRVYYCESRMIDFVRGTMQHAMNVPARYKALGVRRLEQRSQEEVAEATEKLNALRVQAYYSVQENVPRAFSGYASSGLDRTVLSTEQALALPFNTLLCGEALTGVYAVDDMGAV